MQQNVSDSNSSGVLNLWQILKNRYGIILLTILLVTLTAFVITEALPKQYLSTVEIQVKQDGADGAIFDRSSIKGSLASHRFLQTQFEIITSKKILYRVVDELGLMERWGIQSDEREKAYRRLNSMVESKEIPNTELIEIQVFAEDPQLAADIANITCKKYQERRIELHKENAARVAAETEVQLEKAKIETERNRARMLDVREKYGIVDYASGRAWRPESHEADTGAKDLLRTKQNDLYQLEKDINILEANLGTLRGLNGEELVRKAAGLELTDENLKKRYYEYQEMQRSEQALIDSGLGSRHPNVILTRNQIAQLKEQCVEAAVNYQEALETRLNMSQKSLAAADDKTSKDKDEVILEKRKLVDYDEARNQYEQSRVMLGEVKTKLQMRKIDAAMPVTPMEVHAEAEPNQNPAKPRKWFNIVLGAAMGTLLGLGLALFLEFADNSVKSIEDVEQYLGVPVLAVVPNDVGILHQESGASPDAEAYRILRTNIEFNRKSEHLNAISVVSGGAGEGKSTTMVNLAYICAQGGYTTLLIDADLRRPRMHTMFDVSNSVGLTNYLTSDIELEDVVLQTPVDNLYFLPSGILPADAAGVLNSRRMSELMSEVKSRFDLVLVDSPPILGVSDASVIASEVDHAIIVIQYRKLPKKMLLRVKQALENVGCNVMGAVLNNVDIGSDSQYQYYTSYYTYYSPDKVSEAAAPADVATYNEKSSVEKNKTEF